MRCKCGERMYCKDTREYLEGTRRRYHCLSCSERVTTFETIVKGRTRGKNASLEKAFNSQAGQHVKAEILSLLTTFIDKVEKL